MHPYRPVQTRTDPYRQSSQTKRVTILAATIREGAMALLPVGVFLFLTLQSSAGLAVSSDRRRELLSRMGEHEQVSFRETEVFVLQCRDSSAAGNREYSWYAEDGDSLEQLAVKHNWQAAKNNHDQSLTMLAPRGTNISRLIMFCVADDDRIVDVIELFKEQNETLFGSGRDTTTCPIHAGYLPVLSCQGSRRQRLHDCDWFHGETSQPIARHTGPVLFPGVDVPLRTGLYTCECAVGHSRAVMRKFQLSPSQDKPRDSFFCHQMALEDVGTTETAWIAASPTEATTNDIRADTTTFSSEPALHTSPAIEFLSKNKRVRATVVDTGTTTDTPTTDRSTTVADHVLITRPTTTETTVVGVTTGLGLTSPTRQQQSMEMVQEETKAQEPTTTREVLIDTATSILKGATTDIKELPTHDLHTVPVIQSKVGVLKPATESRTRRAVKKAGTEKLSVFPTQIVRSPKLKVAGQDSNDDTQDPSNEPGSPTPLNKSWSSPDTKDVMMMIVVFVAVTVISVLIWALMCRKGRRPVHDNHTIKDPEVVRQSQTGSMSRSRGLLEGYTDSYDRRVVSPQTGAELMLLTELPRPAHAQSVRTNQYVDLPCVH